MLCPTIWWTTYSSVSFTAIFNGTTYVVVIEGFEMSDVGSVLLLSDEVTDGVNIFYIRTLDVGFFMGSPPPGTKHVGGSFPTLVGGHSRNTKSSTE